MGRKIPGRKHRGVKDPEKQRLERFNKIKDKINAAPINPDEQKIPKSLQRLADLRERVKNGPLKKTKHKNKQFPKQFVQLPHENDKQFLYRINKICAAAQHEAAFEQKFGVEVKRNQEGEIEEVKKRPKDIVQVMMKEERLKKKKKKPKKGEEEEPRLNKGQKRRQKLLEKKKKKNAKNENEWENFKDKVEFGEQAHAPPTLKVPPKFQSGKKDLLLNNLLKPTSNNKIDMTVKRKKLPTGVRQRLAKERDEVIKAYRLQKNKQL